MKKKNVERAAQARKITCPQVGREALPGMTCSKKCT